MAEVFEVGPDTDGDAVRRFLAAGAPMAGSQWSQERADLSLRATHRDETARCSLWWTATPDLEGKRTGLIGHYAASGPMAAAALLRDACTRLASQGCETAVGPMDGSTWRRYRFVTERGTEPPFFLEPDNPPQWPLQWEAAGFAPLARYVSSIVGRPDPVPGPSAAEARVAAAGVRLRSVDRQAFEAEIGALFQVALRSFRSNFLYTPVSADEFTAMYTPLRPHLDPRLLWVAERAGRPVGFSFAIPDILEAGRGGPVRTAIVKTLAVDPDAAGQGLGGILAARTLRACWEAGYERAIGALMHEQNRSVRISDHYGPGMRRYTLYSKRLAP